VTTIFCHLLWTRYLGDHTPWLPTCAVELRREVTNTNCQIKQPKVPIDKVALILRIRKAPGWNLLPQTGTPHSIRYGASKRTAFYSITYHSLLLIITASDALWSDLLTVSLNKLKTTGVWAPGWLHAEKRSGDILPVQLHKLSNSQHRPLNTGATLSILHMKYIKWTHNGELTYG
jgi:hypothetical protein